MDLRYRYQAPLSETQIRALARVRDVYGIRALRIDEAANQIAIEYDATRLDAARVSGLLRGCAVAVEPVTA